MNMGASKSGLTIIGFKVSNIVIHASFRETREILKIFSVIYENCAKWSIQYGDKEGYQSGIP